MGQLTPQPPLEDYYGLWSFSTGSFSCINSFKKSSSIHKWNGWRPPRHCERGSPGSSTKFSDPQFRPSPGQSGPQLKAPAARLPWTSHIWNWPRSPFLRCHHSRIPGLSGPVPPRSPGEPWRLSPASWPPRSLSSLEPIIYKNKKKKKKNHNGRLFINFCMMGFPRTSKLFYPQSWGSARALLKKNCVVASPRKVPWWFLRFMAAEMGRESFNSKYDWVFHGSLAAGLKLRPDWPGKVIARDTLKNFELPAYARDAPWDSTYEFYGGTFVFFIKEFCSFAGWSESRISGAAVHCP